MKHGAVLLLLLVPLAILFADGIELIQYSDLRLRNNSSTDAALLHAWTLVRPHGETATMTLTIEPKQVYGSDGCNRFSAPVQVSGNTMKIGAILATRTACEQLKGADAKYRRLLASVETYRINAKGYLELLGAGGTVLLTSYR